MEKPMEKNMPAANPEGVEYFPDKNKS
jgi:hypothetical protein